MKNNLEKQPMPKYLLAGALLILLYWSLNNINVIDGYIQAAIRLVQPFLIGGVIAFIFNVPMRQVEKLVLPGARYAGAKYQSIRRACAYVITLVMILAVITMAMFVVVPELVSTVADLILTIPANMSNLQKLLMEQLEEYPVLKEKLSGLSIDWDMALKSAASFLSNGTILSSGTKGLIMGSIGAVSSIVSGITSFFIGFVFSVYILFQKEKLGRQATRILYALFSEKTAKKTLEIASLANTTFANFLSGQCLEAVILGSMFAVSMSLLHMPYALLIGILIAFTALIPIVGAFIGCVAGIILIGFINPWQAAGFLVLFLVLQQIEGNLIYPHVVGNSVGLPGIWVLTAVTIGGNLFGIAGMLTFIPICSVLYALFRSYISRRLKEKQLQNDEM